MSSLDCEPNYWLFGWLDSHKIHTTQDLRTALGNQSLLSELREVAEAWWEATPIQPPTGTNLVAGTGLRLDDLLTCPSHGCRRQQVDVLFRHAWHYFDLILLPDGVGRLLIRPPSSWDQTLFLDALFDWICLVIYIRDIGASNLVHYYPKPWESAIDQHGLLNDKNADVFASAVRDVEAVLAQQGDCTFNKIGPSSFQIKFADPLLRVSTNLELTFPKGKKVTEKYLREVVAHHITHEHIEYLLEDLYTRNHLEGSLGSIVWSHERVISRIATPSAKDVALHLFLPSLYDIPVKELIAVRTAEADSFEVFRAALTKAAQEILKRNPASNPQDVADSIITEIVQPELAKLQRRLHTAQSVLARKTAISIGLAGLATTCGLMLGAGPLVAGLAGIGAMASGTSAAAAKYVEEKQTVEMSDMYFLWKALEHAR